VVQLREKQNFLKLLKRRVIMASGSVLMENNKAIVTCRGSERGNPEKSFMTAVNGLRRMWMEVSEPVLVSQI